MSYYIFYNHAHWGHFSIQKPLDGFVSSKEDAVERAMRLAKDQNIQIDVFKLVGEVVHETPTPPPLVYKDV